MAITSTEKKRRFILFSLLGLAAAVVIVLASFLLFTPEKPSGTSKMASARTEAVSGQAGGVGSEEYNQKLKEHDAQQANAALQSGASFIPTPIGEKKSVVIKKQDTPPSPPPVAQVRTVPVQTPRTDNAMLKRMMDDLAELDTRLASASVGQGQIAYVREFQDETGQQESEKTACLRDAVGRCILQTCGETGRPVVRHHRCGSELRCSVRRAGDRHLRHIQKCPPHRLFPAP